MQRCRELFAAAMRRVDDLVYNPEGDRLLLRGEEADDVLVDQDVCVLGGPPRLLTFLESVT